MCGAYSWLEYSSSNVCYQWSLPGSSSNIHPPHVTIATRDTITSTTSITSTSTTSISTTSTSTTCHDRNPRYHQQNERNYWTSGGRKNLSFPTFDISSSVWSSLRNHIHCPTVADSSETQLIINARNRYNITRKYLLFRDMCLVTWYFGLTVHFGWILYHLPPTFYFTWLNLFNPIWGNKFSSTFLTLKIQESDLYYKHGFEIVV